MNILRNIVHIICFIVLMVTADVVWTNIKGYYAERNFKICAAYFAGGIMVFCLLLGISTAANTYFR
ncbi:hypothetical protein [Selenomonas ruminis]|uniref:Uncharacterized protein n=1 Tax=Selenomonas ruminis TaxID=2593411 RepID=A0A5D6WB97_9FIRM|nr:hypothetical protein [Selenomonas sp. mPRGC5]TYZ25070.1 hypothetical protein FZ040_03325 [Selenomonas sp. mPRGC5]